MNTPAFAARWLSAGGSDSTAPRLRALFSPRLLACLATLAVSVSASTARAQIAYDESVSGDLSNSGLTPTPVTLHSGSNLIFGSTGRSTATDRDYFTVTIPLGLTLNAIWELAGTQAGGVSFFGIQAGPQVTLPPSTAVATGLLGWTHYAATGVNIDLFPLIGIPSDGSTGFSEPLGPGVYSFWVQDFTSGTYNYAFDLHLASPVPEPSTYAAAGGALLVALAFRRRFVKSAQPVAVVPSKTV